MINEEKETIEFQNNSINNAIDFYMIANNFKYITDKNNESILDHIYGAIILAVALNSEYGITNDLAQVIRTILLSKMYDYDKKIEQYLTGKSKYMSEVYEYFWNQTSEGYFASECVDLEKKLSSFLNARKYTDLNDYNTIYSLANEQGLFDRIGINEKNREVFRFYYINNVLKNKLRSGWNSTHWNVSGQRIERISEHVIGTIALAISLDLEFDFNINLDKVINTLAIHEIGEIFIDDITPFDGINSEEKKKIEHSAMKKAVGDLSYNDKLLDMLYEFDEQKTEDTKFAYYCDKLEADIQSKVYQDMGCHHPLTEQENNVVFKSSKVQKMLEDGAQTAFDIWYEWDKSIYEKEETFTKVLKYIKDNNIKRD